MITNVIEVSDDRSVVGLLHRSPKTLWLWPFHYSKFVTRTKHTTCNPIYTKDWINVETGRRAYMPANGQRVIETLSGAVTAHLLEQELKDEPKVKVPTVVHDGRTYEITGSTIISLLTECRETYDRLLESQKDTYACRLRIDKLEKIEKDLRRTFTVETLHDFQRGADIQVNSGNMARLINERDQNKSKRMMLKGRLDKSETALVNARADVTAQAHRADKAEAKLQAAERKLAKVEVPRFRKAVELNGTSTWSVDRIPEFGPDGVLISTTIRTEDGSSVYASMRWPDGWGKFQAGGHIESAPAEHAKVTIPASTMNLFVENLLGKLT